MNISLYCGDSHEAWSPKSVETGIGGSEEAVVYLSRELAALGHTVTVYNRCEDDAGDYAGVRYVDYLDYEGEPTDIMVGWRNESVWKAAKNFKVGYHWLHDTTEENRVFLAMHLGAHKVMVLSQYHRRLYPKLRNEEIFVTQNGVNLADFDQKVERVPGRMFYGSSYDRGLKELLEEWPKIKLAVPEATLHIAYGWQTWEKIATARQDEHFPRIKEQLEQMMEQEGITHLGRISHQEVAKEMLEASVWGYPTWWPEISCITAMKAQVGGAIPVVIPTAAVAETVQYGYRTDRGCYMDVDGNPAIRPKEALDQWTEGAIKFLQEDNLGRHREAMTTWAKEKFDWKTVVSRWEKEFLLELLRRNKTSAA